MTIRHRILAAALAAFCLDATASERCLAHADRLNVVANNYVARATTAQFAFPYAIMSYEAYEEPSVFPLPAEWREAPDLAYEGKKGLAYKVYEKTDNGTVSEVAIAFRGTEFWSIEDWLYGNFSNAQYRYAKSHLDEIRRKYPDVAMVATGHSLGGGVSIRASYDYERMRAVTFSTSPMYRDEPPNENPRAIIYESGDPVRTLSNLFLPHRWRWVRRKGRWEAGELHDPKELYFQRYDFLGWSVFTDHSMEKLAEGLLMIAAKTNPRYLPLLISYCDRANAFEE